MYPFFALIIYLKFVIDHKPKTIFIDLVKLDQTDAESVFKAIISSLNEFGLTKQKIRDDLIQVVSDGASAFVGKKAALVSNFWN